MVGDWSADIPEWVPEYVRHYIAHTEFGAPIRQLARAANVHASTVMRQVRRMESRRDDPLVDGAVRRLAGTKQLGQTPFHKDVQQMNHPSVLEFKGLPDQAQVEREGKRLLNRMARPGAMLAVARDMEMGVVIEEDAEGIAQRTAVVDRTFAEAIALKEWIQCDDPEGRIVRYTISPQGRSALKKFMGAGQIGFAVAPAQFDHCDPAAPGNDIRLRHMRTVMADSPLAGLSRRRDKSGKPFLARDLVAAGERLREDFELAQAGPKTTQNWESFLTAGITGHAPSDSRNQSGSAAAQERVSAALSDLGPGLGDVALRCCCYLEGMESLEKRMDWSARSGKIVLRIALQRLKRHYHETQGKYGPMIG
ncbi:MAG: helix-turn-helix domain-containing protein [Rhodobacteraceae bacterium]|nr:helix-turn-helix domain-containing protein [Paracoccaceae bacterium]